MLEFLRIAGTVMVAGRVECQKTWDLAEHCLPPWTPRATRAVAAVIGNAMGKLRRYNNTHLPWQVRVSRAIDCLHLDQYRLLVWLARIEEEQVVCADDNPLA